MIVDVARVLQKCECAGYAVQDGTILLDVTNLTSFEVNSTANTVTFGPGLRLGQLYLRMYMDADSLFPAGTCPWVGTPGHILGTTLSLNKSELGAESVCKASCLWTVYAMFLLFS